MNKIKKVDAEVAKLIILHIITFVRVALFNAEVRRGVQVQPLSAVQARRLGQTLVAVLEAAVADPELRAVESTLRTSRHAGNVVKKVARAAARAG